VGTCWAEVGSGADGAVREVVPRASL